MLLRVLTECCGAIVTAVASAEDALTAFRTAPPSVLVADLAMPRHDGLWLIRAIRALPRDAGGEVPAIAVTAFHEEPLRAQALAEGFEVYITKPFGVPALCETIRKLAAAPR